MTCSNAEIPNRRWPVLLVLPLAALLSACTLPVSTSPDTFDVAPAALAHLPRTKPVTVENGYTADAPYPFKVEMHTWVVDQRQITDTAVVMLDRALAKQGLAAGPGGKTVRLRVQQPSAYVRMLPFVAQTFATLTLDAEFGDGTRTSVRADNQSPMSGPRAFEGAVLFALNQLLSDERFVAYMNRDGMDLGKPAAAAPAATATPAPVVAASIAMSSAAAAPDARFPQVGDNWTYRLTQRGRNVGPTQRRYAVKVVYSSEAKISDQVSIDHAPPTESDHAKGRYLITQGVSILSPYLGVFEEPSAGASLGEIVTSTNLGCRVRERCEVSGRIVGREIVRVPAGEFEAIKVTVSQVWRDPMGFQGGTSDARRVLTGWYAPQAKRFVKFSSRPGMGNAPDFDLELVSYQLK